jgi:ankyrin repeat protein
LNVLLCCVAAIGCADTEDLEKEERTELQPPALQERLSGENEQTRSLTTDGLVRRLVNDLNDKEVKARARAARSDKSAPPAIVLAAIRAGDFDEALSRVESDPGLLDWSDENGRSLLHHAAASQYSETTGYVFQLARLARDVNVRDGEGATPLHHAAGAGGAIGALILQGADLNAKTYKGDTPLHWAAFSHRHEIALTLLGWGAEPDIYALCALNMGLEVKTLLDRTPELTSRADATGKTPLHFAAEYGGPELVFLLLERGSDVNAQDVRFYSPLHYAALAIGGRKPDSWIMRRNLEKLELLLGHGANVDIVDRSGRTAADLALRQGWDDAARLIQRWGLDE